MAVVPLNTINVLNDVKVTIGTDSYEPAISQALLQVDVSQVAYKGMTPGASYKKSTSPEYSFQLTAAADWDDEDSLANKLWDDAGTEVSITFEPKAGGTSFG